MAELNIKEDTVDLSDFRLVRQKPFKVSSARNIRVPLVVPVERGDTYHVYQDLDGNLLLMKA
jgi:hypothetical protein